MRQNSNFAFSCLFSCIILLGISRIYFKWKYLVRIMYKKCKVRILAHFDPRLWPYPLMKFNEILTCYRVWSLLFSCRKEEVKPPPFGKKNIFLYLGIFSTYLNANRWNSLKLNTTLIFTQKLPKSDKMPLIPFFYSACTYM